MASSCSRPLFDDKREIIMSWKEKQISVWCGDFNNKRGIATRARCSGSSPILWRHKYFLCVFLDSCLASFLNWHKLPSISRTIPVSEISNHWRSLHLMKYRFTSWSVTTSWAIPAHGNREQGTREHGRGLRHQWSQGPKNRWCDPEKQPNLCSHELDIWNYQYQQHWHSTLRMNI